MTTYDMPSALRTICWAIFGTKENRTILTGSDFKDIRAMEVSRDFAQGEDGVLVQFVISNHGLEKVLRQESADAMDYLTRVTREGAG